jgi:hypothetical protein
MFHVELRQFPHNACAFNLTEAELARIVEPWSRDEWIEFGERKWSPHQARLTVLDGPHLPIEELAMGRGWRNAQHHSTDVTERVIAQALASTAAAPAAGGTVTEPPADITELQSLLGSDPGALLQAWRLAAQRRPELSPSESLTLAERTLSSLDVSSS